MPHTACSQSLSSFERQKHKQRRAERGTPGIRVCYGVCLRVCILQAASPGDRARWSPPAKQVGPVYLLLSGSCQFRSQLSRNTFSASVPKTPRLIAPLFFVFSFAQFHLSSPSLRRFRKNVIKNQLLPATFLFVEENHSQKMEKNTKLSQNI